MALDKLITLKQAAYLLGIGESTLRKQVSPDRKGGPLIETRNIGRAVRVRLSDVQKIIGGQS